MTITLKKHKKEVNLGRNWLKENEHRKDQEKQNVVLWENKIEKFLAKPNKKKMLQRDNTGMKKGTWQMQYRFRIC